MRSVCALATLVLLANAADGNRPSGGENATDSREPKLVGWVRVPEPSQESITCANWTLRSWRLEPGKDGTPAIVPNDELMPRRDPVPFQFHCPMEREQMPSRRVAFDLGTDLLIGCDLGTRGGGLWVVDSFGVRKTRLWPECVWDVVSVGGRVMVLTRGETSDEGVILEAMEVAGVWAVRTFVEVPGYPLGAIDRGDHIYVITMMGMFSVADGRVTPIMPLDLAGLLPTSVLSTESGEIYIAMRHFTLRLRQASGGWMREWLAPVDCQFFRKRDQRPCDCVAP